MTLFIPCISADALLVGYMNISTHNIVRIQIALSSYETLQEKHSRPYDSIQEPLMLLDCNYKNERVRVEIQT